MTQQSKSSSDSDLARCKRASQLYNGAPISRVQLRAVESKITRSHKTLASRNRTALKRYAQSEVSASALDSKLREMLRSVNEMYAKSWSRKSAAIMCDAIVKTQRASRRSQSASAQQ